MTRNKRSISISNQIANAAHDEVLPYNASASKKPFYEMHEIFLDLQDFVDAPIKDGILEPIILLKNYVAARTELKNFLLKRGDSDVAE